MRIVNVTDPKKFFETVGTCTGKVELHTNQGDQINLKSKLCQYIMMSEIFNGTMGDFDIMCSEPDDYLKIFEFLVRG